MKLIQILKSFYKINPNLEQIAAARCVQELKEIMISDKNLKIAELSTNTVFSSGRSDSKLMLIGEAPGRDEDLAGVPFIGRSGKYLNGLLESVNLSRENDVYVSNLLNWRPDNNRVPTEDEILYCLPYLEKHIDLHNPRLIGTLGSTATFALLARGLKPLGAQMKPLIAKVYKYKNCFSKKELPLFVMYHPSYMMRNHNMQDVFKQHFVRLKSEFYKTIRFSDDY